MSANPEVTLEELEARHRTEKKELVARVTALKKTVPKGDKRKKKEVGAEIAELEKEQADRHGAELKRFGEEQADDEQQATGGLGADRGPAATSDCEEPAAPAGGMYGNFGQAGRQGGKKSKAKQRQQRKADEQRRLQEETEQEAANMVDVAADEAAAIGELARARGLCVREIRADGHCLYSAIADQLCAYHGQPAAYPQIRKRAAEYMRSHRDDFIPFMAREDGEMFDEDDYARHCDDVESTAAWGGQQEITALSHALELPIHVYQIGMPVLRVGEEEYGAKAPVNLSYHRHAYGLGEHYNSLRRTDSS
ncbi:OTU protein [Coemansia biformis]|uniref:OTU protein n=1 Tax=Coemansia biformis TaxID=1286918 RepID=A0A9W8CXG6_9FUNG|nr:OTU protein [Coemansia biformis]